MNLVVRKLYLITRLQFNTGKTLLQSQKENNKENSPGYINLCLDCGYCSSTYLLFR